MVSKGFLKPDDICKVDYDGKQLAGTRKRTSEVLLHLVVYKNRPDVQRVVHCHPPHATAFAVAHEPIPKCVLPEVEVFLGEVPIAKYATPGDQRLPNTIVPYVKDCNTILLANHGTVTWGPTLENAYFNTEIIDAYCRILILSKLLGRVNYFSDAGERRADGVQEEAEARRPAHRQGRLRAVRPEHLRGRLRRLRAANPTPSAPTPRPASVERRPKKEAGAAIANASPRRPRSPRTWTNSSRRSPTR